MNKSEIQGFTLLELLIVVLVVALVLAVSYPSLSRGSASIHLRTTGRDVLNTFRFAREKAVTEQIGMKVTVDRENQRLVLANELGDGSRTYAMPSDVKIHRIALGGREIPEGPVGVRFLPNGSSDAVELLLKSKTDSLLRIISDPITGGARIETGSGENFR
ncbi:MAG: prepilin-type N-terminal cleavage/methylation domain-containing protein [Acidobacteria bacterium]|nr:prepilin-type N-terminal cleavage/methylation domain-containing protein [Acidobacteriota bacterium]